MSTDPNDPNTTPALPQGAPEATPPIRVVPLLGYEPVDPNQSRVPLYRQFLAGFFLPIVYGLCAGSLAVWAPSGLAPVIGLVALIAFIPLVAIIHAQTRWTAFVPGVLTGIFGLPVLAAAVCAIIVAANGLNIH